MRRSDWRRFAYRLAVRLGYVNVDAMLRCITIKQLWDWAAYAELEPFDETRADVRAAQVAQMVFNMAVDRKDRKKLADFVLKFGEPMQPKRRQTPEEQLQILKVLSLMNNLAPNKPD